VIPFSERRYRSFNQHGRQNHTTESRRRERNESADEAWRQGCLAKAIRKYGKARVRKIVRPVLQPTATKATVKTPAKPPTPTTVTLKHLAAAVAEQHDMPKKQADTILADVFGRIVDHLKAGDRVRIGDLGIIEVKNRLARMGRNPSTGEAIQIKASKKVAFRASKELKNAI
jgi:DNA-binding protein HU-beta